MSKKYVVTKESLMVNGKALYRIKALRNFGDVKKGDLGGYVASEKNLSHDGICWIYDNAKVFEDEYVYGKAKVRESAEVSGHAKVFGSAEIAGYANIFGYARVCGYAKVYGCASVSGSASVSEFAEVYDNAKVCGNVVLCGNVWVYRNAERSYQEPEFNCVEKALFKVADVVTGKFRKPCNA